MSDWTPMQQKYQLWLAIPARARPEALRNRGAFARRLGVTLATLRRWEVEPGWWDAVFQQARAIIGRQLGGILNAMAKAAQAGSVAAAKLCLEVLGVHHMKIQHEVDMQGDQLIIMLHPDALPPPHLQLPQATRQSGEIIDGVVLERSSTNVGAP